MDVDFASRHGCASRSRWPPPTASCDERELLTVELKGDDDVVGWGEAAPLEPYDGVLARGRARGARRPTSRSCATATSASGAELLDACRAAADLPQALAAVDMALWDRAGNREGKPGQRRCWPTTRPRPCA